jgi:hypothetical protein
MEGPDPVTAIQFTTPRLTATGRDCINTDRLEKSSVVSSAIQAPTSPLYSLLHFQNPVNNSPKPPFHPRYPSPAKSHHILPFQQPTLPAPITPHPMGGVTSCLRNCINGCISIMHEHDENMPEGHHIARRVRVDFAPVEWDGVPAAPRSLSTAVSPYALPPSPYGGESRGRREREGGRVHGSSRSLDEVVLRGGERWRT